MKQGREKKKRKIDKTRNWLFQKFYKIGKLLARLTKPEKIIKLVESGKK